ncbi:MAG: hypothetical protein V1676_03815 [Candidatus Diapherotrites archaeon]
MGNQPQKERSTFTAIGTVLFLFAILFREFLVHGVDLLFALLFLGAVFMGTGSLGFLLNRFHARAENSEVSA